MNFKNRVKMICAMATAIAGSSVAFAAEYQFGAISYDVPAGWLRVEQPTYVVLASSSMPGGHPEAAIIVSSQETYSGRFQEWFSNTIIQGEANERSLSRSGVQKIESKGDYEALLIQSATQDRSGMVTHRIYVATNATGKAQLFIFITYTAQSAQDNLGYFRQFLESVEYGHQTEKPAPAPNPSGKNCRVVTQQQCMSGFSGGVPTYNCLPVARTICN